MQQQDYIYSDIDSSSDIEEILNFDSNEENKLLYLTKMGFSEAEASIAMERCGPDSSIAELTDFICADQMAKAVEVLLPVEDQITQRTLPEDAIGSPYFYYEQIHLSNPMIGFGVRTKSDHITQRTLPEDAIGPPYFYHDNVALAPVNVWTGISQYLFDVEPEFVDSKHFCAASLKWGYIHNLPIENRFPLILSAKLTERIRKNKIVPLEPDEVEMLLGFPKTHTRGAARDMFSSDINVLSLFSGISGAEQSSEGHNGYHLDKENDRHRRNSNDVSRLELASRYNQSEDGLPIFYGYIYLRCHSSLALCELCHMSHFEDLVFHNSLSPSLNTFTILAS
ncbi:hypothetical protein F3Y22_tig00112281pilonHSYRG00106 [Hibiscus syriacus]|uniref:SAM-dependent MTase DRM-type domain-containing protein n=1 Tax=Hibiscus syriacus TaxID=106335 RepID=A0A6A2X2R4_HIBSY|nr:hypothetical protein F3Y22_tig00112281pilonHSYRG00106 [Hibiscus syriacus]